MAEPSFGNVAASSAFSLLFVCARNQCSGCGRFGTAMAREDGYRQIYRGFDKRIACQYLHRCEHVGSVRSNSTAQHAQGSSRWHFSGQPRTSRRSCEVFRNILIDTVRTRARRACAEAERARETDRLFERISGESTVVGYIRHRPQREGGIRHRHVIVTYLSTNHVSRVI